MGSRAILYLNTAVNDKLLVEFSTFHSVTMPTQPGGAIRFGNGGSIVISNTCAANCSCASYSHFIFSVASQTNESYNWIIETSVTQCKNESAMNPIGLWSGNILIKTCNLSKNTAAHRCCYHTAGALTIPARICFTSMENNVAQGVYGLTHAEKGEYLIYNCSVIKCTTDALVVANGAKVNATNCLFINNVIKSLVYVGSESYCNIINCYALTNGVESGNIFDLNLTKLTKSICNSFPPTEYDSFFIDLPLMEVFIFINMNDF